MTATPTNIKNTHEEHALRTRVGSMTLCPHRTVAPMLLRRVHAQVWPDPPCKYFGEGINARLLEPGLQMKDRLDTCEVSKQPQVGKSCRVALAWHLACFSAPPAPAAVTAAAGARGSYLAAVRIGYCMCVCGLYFSTVLPSLPISQCAARVHVVFPARHCSTPGRREYLTR